MVFYLQSETCCISIPELTSTSLIDHRNEVPVKQEPSLTILSEVFGSDISTSLGSKIKNNDNSTDENYSCGKFTTIAGILIEVLEQIEKIKSTKEGNKCRLVVIIKLA